MTNYIWITTQKEMYHQYPNAPNEVMYLKNIHRHIFKFKIYIQVYDDDRDIEFIMFKHDVEKIIETLDKQLKQKSCEMISNYINQKIMEKYPYREVIIEVSEDGENGSLYKYPKSKRKYTKSQPLNTS